MKRALPLLLPLLAGAKGLTIDDMLAMQRISDPAVSPDGKLVAFAVRDTDFDANRGRYDIWLTATDGTGSATRLTTNPDNDTDPAWSPDGKLVYFLSSRGGSSSQVWRIAVTGGEAQQVTHLPVDVDGFKLFPDGRRIALVAKVWPDARSLADSARHDDDVAKKKMKARIETELLYRHWDHWADGRFSHLFAWDPARADTAIDLTPGLATDVPPGPFGGMEEIAIAPDGKTAAFVERVGGRAQAWTTNTDVFLVGTDGHRAAIDLTSANHAYDDAPSFSPDGKTLAVLAMSRPGFESDRRRIVLYDVATHRMRVVADNWDASPDTVTWSADGRTLYAAAEHLGSQPIYAIDVQTGAQRTIVDTGTSDSPRVAGDRVVFVRDTLAQPAELFTVPASGGAPTQITHLNDDRVKHIAWGAYEQFSFKGAHDDTVYGYVVKPANFTGGKVPVAFLIHGGPQGSFGDHFHYRWNPEVFAGHGYAVVMIDFHGSTGYGQAFTDAISGDWGGAPFEDLMKGLDAALAKYSFLDADRVAALGASYGGYMINWINGNTDRFRALVCHDGIFDTRMAYYDTEEVWFPEWEHHGTPWDHPEEFAKSNPAEHVKAWKTPELVIHGALDYRIPESHGIAAFTALQRKGVPSKFIEFPDENHWVQKPQNSKLWHDEVFAWIDRWTARR